ncbi:GNAT family N-acetyltransferase [Chromobacterium subtsugae]|uniref:GNAT family N-acetyltransferase n=1 Tax=Chromobacterium subtsugae TaxID=251747 RepID=UPI000640BAA3|nr:GNAT family N-acetyltransferase [Chromobacterium subtsugae]
MPAIIRQALPSDLETIVLLRMRLFDDAAALNGVGPDETIRAATIAYFRQALQGGDCVTWVSEEAGQVVAIGSLAVFARPPYPGNAAGRDAYLLNMYTLPDHRGQGHARAIVRSALALAQRRGYGKVWLHATEAGRPLYRQEGFLASADYMEWVAG